VYVENSYVALNYLLQSAGAVVMKRALVILDAKVTEPGLDVSFVGNIHDEFQAEVNPKDTPEYRRMAEDAMREAGEYYNMRVPLAGETKVGQTWRETH
jgi:DNA polymerase I-like protein with 3'-5' exonuclease and polymerase domains